jgi:hypothetical protein
MTYAFTMDVPIDSAFYQRIVDGLGTDVPTGLVAHLAVERPEGGLRYFEVWDSEDDWSRFREERLHPVVHPMLEELLGVVPPEPDLVPLPLIHAWTRHASVTGQRA